MPLSWNEIKDRAIRFSKDWQDVSSEDAEAKSFWDAFFDIFGVSRRKVATFEKPVKRLDESTGYIDLLWKGTIMVEHKSRGKDLDRAYRQAIDYFPGLKDYELPKYILVSDFARFRLYDLEEDHVHEFHLEELYKNVKEFGFIAGFQKHTFREQDPVNIHAAELMGKLHDRLKAVGYTGHPLEVYLVRLLFCLFAEDTSIFEKDLFKDYIVNKTKEDGSDLAHHLASLFYNLNTPKEKRLSNLDEELAAFPYVNGKLFEENLPPAAFDTSMREILLECTGLDWGKISPAIFGSLFQSVMNPKERRNLGAHYTSEKNILKVIKPLFLDDLWKEFESAKENRNKLIQFHDRLASLRFLDPACGCGNFLVISYRELRLLEHEIIKVLHKNQQVFDILELIKLDVDRFYGIEIEEFPSQIAQVAMWLMDHQMNMKVSEEFGQYFLRLPLRKSPNIVCANALQTDWQSLIEPVPWESGEQRYNYIYGNPPFIGSKMMSQEQRNEVVALFDNMPGSGVLDFVTAWYAKAAKYLHDGLETMIRKTKIAFVSTNSIVQGEQVGALWGHLISKYRLSIFFAHTTFKWSNEARGNAAVYCVIIGFEINSSTNKRIFIYDDIKRDPHLVKVSHINPYLVEGKDVFIKSRQIPVCSIPEMTFGNMPLDGGNLLLNEDEKTILLNKEPQASKFIKPLISAKEFLNNGRRWCLWFVGVEPNEYRSLPLVMERIEKVRQFRIESKAPSTRKFALVPSLFRDRNNPDTCIVVPRVSSENRKYIPMGFFGRESIVSDTCMSIPDGNLFHFGILSSEMHMTWVKYVCGRLKSDYRYSKDIVYNNFPWPENPSEKQVKSVEEAAQKVLDTRTIFHGSSLADLYDPLTMPPALVKAHQELDRSVDLCYRPQPFINETKRIEYLFELYDKYTAGLFMAERSKKRKK